MKLNALDRENYFVIQAMQATLGLITENVYAIAVQVDTERITLHFAVSNISSDFEEDVDDIKSELDAFLEGRFHIDVEVYVGLPDGVWPGRSWRLIYLRHSRMSGN
ncbi:hypothetical protein AB0945_12780 [Streptomyces sp. NPDC005474]|uniref:hypothetical protein n=1 Tax=Streptomyces sp. NPDC005474 TaxID=3154878 RepID=UPI00345202C1